MRLATPGLLAVAGLLGCGSTTRSATDESSTSSSGGGGSGGTHASDMSTTGGGGPAGLPGLPDAWLSCSDSSECSVTFAGCCDPCSEASVADNIAIATSSIAAYRDSVCPEERICPRCVSIPNPYLHATCTEGSCTLVDVASTPLVSCSQSSDCKLRAAACCECDASASFISINTASEAAFAELVCGPEPSCPECSLDPTDIDPACDEGRCVVRSFPP